GSVGGREQGQVRRPGRARPRAVRRREGSQEVAEGTTGGASRDDATSSFRRASSAQGAFMDSKASRPVNWTAQEEATGGRLIDRLDGIVHPAERLFAFIASVCIFALMLIGVVNIVG